MAPTCHIWRRYRISSLHLDPLTLLWTVSIRRAKDAGNAHVTYFPPSRPTQYKAVVPTKPRPDGRDSETVRPLQSEVDILPRVHGSALFSRGTTQSLCSTTLAPVQSAQTINRVTEVRGRAGMLAVEVIVILTIFDGVAVTPIIS